jgi:hypothetical protein
METEPKGLSEHPTDDARIADSSMGDKLVELQIELDDTGLLVRGFANYLELIDGFYGRSHPRGFRSYAHLPDEQVEFAEVRPGSLELIISEIVESSQTVAPVVVLYLLLKYLPEFLKSIISTYKDFEEAKYLKVRRAQIEKQMQDEDEIENLGQDQRQKLVKTIDEIYIAERDTIRKSVNFINNRFRTIKFKP